MKKLFFNAIVATVVALASTLTSCVSDEPVFENSSEHVVETMVTFDLHVSQNLLDHFMVDALWNTDDGLDAQSAPVLLEDFSHTYAPANGKRLLILVIQCARNNRPVSTLTPGEITVVIHETFVMNTGRVVTNDIVSVAHYNGVSDVFNVHNRTWSVNVDASGTVTHVIPENYSI